MRWRLVAIAIGALGLGSVIAYGQSVGPNSLSQFNTSGAFGGIAGVTSDGANVGFATSSHLYIYGFGSGNCLKSGAGGQIADAGSPCGGSGSPGGVNTQVQFNTFGAFGGITGATSNGSNISFTTNSLVINGQAISNVSGTTGTLATVSGSLASNCVKADGNGNLVNSGSACGGTSATNIAAGTNITTSGTTANVTVNVVVTPSFTTVIASGNITAGTAQFTGQLTGTSAVFQTATVNNLTPTGPNCLQETSGVLQATNTPCATQTATPSIAAGSNITTSGTAANTTINVVATPSFTTVIASGNLTAATAQFSGFLSAGGASLSGLTINTATYSGNLTGTSANFSGNLTGTTAQFTGLLTGTNAVFQTVTVSNLTPTGPNCLQETGGVLQATNSACASATGTSIAAGTNITTSGTASNITVNVVATPSFTTVVASGNITAGTAQFTGLLTGTNAVFQTVTVNNLTPTGPNCLQETGGVLQATNVPCATQTSTPSIAAGTNITTSGTATNITVNMVPTTPEFGLQYNHAGLLTADTGFTYGSSPGIATLTLGPGNLTTTNSRAFSIIGTISSGTVQFNPPFFMNITTNAFASGTKLMDIQASGISYLTVFASSGMTVLGNITGTLGSISGWLTAPGVNMQTATIAGALIGSTGNFSSNLTGTTANFSSNLTANIAQFAGFLSAGGASLSGLTIQTATFSSNLTGTTANFSSNLTANIAQFAGFLSAGGASLSGLTIQTATFSSNLTGTTANLSSNLTAQIAQFPGWLTAAGANVQSITIATNLTGSQANFSSTLTASIYTGTGTGAGALAFITPGISEFGLGSPAAANTGWINWGGESRLAADKGLNISNAGLTPTTLSVNVQGGRTYSIDADLYVTLAVAATSGIAVSLSGTYGSTDTHYFGYVVDGGSNTSAAGTSNPIRGATLASAKNTIVGNVSLSGTTGYVALKGTVSVQTAGTLLIAAATVNTQTAANGVSLTRGSRILVHDMP